MLSICLKFQFQLLEEACWADIEQGEEQDVPGETCLVWAYSIIKSSLHADEQKLGRFRTRFEFFWVVVTSLQALAK